LNATPDISGPEPGGLTDHQDGVLSVADEIYLPKGKEASRWAETSEFEEFAERLGRNDGCFGMGDSSGLTLETPFGENASLIRLQTTERHPYLGSGLLASLLTPLSRSDAELEEETCIQGTRSSFPICCFSQISRPMQRSGKWPGPDGSSKPSTPTCKIAR
jgi:hypothetical protein